MRTKVLLTVAVIAMLLVGTAAIASNMGFKISIPLLGAGKTNWVSLPYYNQYTTVSVMWADIANVAEITRYDGATDTAESYFGGFLDPDFAIVSGTAYLVKITGANANWIVVGSHNPTLAVSLLGGSKTNWLSVPYHTTAADVATLWSQIPNVAEITRYDGATDMAESYFGGFLDPNFAITAGNGYLVKISGANATWTPAHY